MLSTAYCYARTNVLELKSIIKATRILFQYDIFIHSLLLLTALYYPPTGVYRWGDAVGVVHISRETTACEAVDIEQSNYFICHLLLLLSVLNCPPP